MPFRNEQKVYGLNTRLNFLMLGSYVLLTFNGLCLNAYCKAMNQMVITLLKLN